MNKNQVSCSGIYEYRESKKADVVFVNVFEHNREIFVFFPKKDKCIPLSDISDTAIFSKWI